MEEKTEVTFNGECAYDSFGKRYPIPGNYISKSRLLPGDIMNMYFSEGGIYFKVVKSSKNKLVKGTVTNHKTIVVFGKEYNIHISSYAYYKLKAGDEIFARIREDGGGFYCAVEGRIE